MTERRPWLGRTQRAMTGMRLPLVLAGIAGAAAALLVVFASGIWNPARPHGVTGAAAANGFPLAAVRAPDFTLLDQFGRRRSLSSFHGREVALAFIDDRCTTVCPLTAEILRAARGQLGPLAASRVALVAVNANPTATGVAVVHRWSVQHGMLHMWTFLTGPLRRLRAVYRAYHIFDQVAAGGQVVHDPAIVIIDPSGRERFYFDAASSRAGATVLAEQRAYAAAMRSWSSEAK